MGETPDEKANYALTWNIDAMKALVHDEYVNFTKFAKEKDEFSDDIDYTLTWIERNTFERDYKAEISYMQQLSRSLSYADDLRNKFGDCHYWGSDLVMQMAILRVLVLHNFDESKLDKSYQRKKDSLEFLMEQIEDRASKDTKMSSRMQKEFEESRDHTKRAFNVLKNTKDASQNFLMEGHKTCSEF